MTKAEAKRFRNSSDPRVRAEARRVLDAEKARRERTAPRRRDREKRKASDAAAHAIETARIRVACVAREDGRGAFCGRLFSSADPGEMCHLDGGSGKRRQQQRVENCAMEHHECHQGPLGLDRKPLAWLPAVKAWAERHGYPVPERFRKLEALRCARKETPCP